MKHQAYTEVQYTRNPKILFGTNRYFYAPDLIAWEPETNVH